MSLNVFGGGPADVTTDSQGNVVGGVDVKVYTARNGGQRVTELYDIDDSPLGGVVKSVAFGGDQGRIAFKASDTYSKLYIDSGTGMRWVLPAAETYDAVKTALVKSEEARGTASTALTVANAADDKATNALDLITSGEVASNQNIQQAIDQIQTITPTTDELTETVYISSMVSGSSLTSTFVVNDEVPLWVAPFDATILSVGMVFENFSSASPLSDTDYLNFYLLRRRLSDTTKVMARGSTDLTGGTDVIAGQGWEWDHSFYWESEHQTLKKGEVLTIKYKTYGSHAAISLPVTITFRYRPL